LILTLLGALGQTSLLAGPPAVVKEIVLHVYSEDLTYVPTGPYARHVAFIENMKVRGYPVNSANSGTATLFDLSGITPRIRPNGLAYIQSESKFAVVTRTTMDRMYIVDANGRLESTRPIGYPAGYVPEWVEGLGYIPPESIRYPDHLALCTGRVDQNTGDARGDILILRRDGTLAQQIPIPGPYSECGAVAWQAPDRLLVSATDDGVWGKLISVLDFDGQVPPLPSIRMPGGIEGIVTLPDSSVLAVGSGGTIYALDAMLVRQLARDRQYASAAGVRPMYGATWDTGRNLFVIGGSETTEAFNGLFSLAPPYTVATRLLELFPRPAPPQYSRPGRMTFLPDEKLIAVRHARRQEPPSPNYVPESILLFNNTDGSLYETLSLRPLALGNPRALTYMPGLNQFALSFMDYATSYTEPGKVYIVARNGTLVRSIDYSGKMPVAVTSMAFFNPAHPSGGQLLLCDGWTFFVGDLNGNISAQYEASELIGVGNILDLATVTTGEYAGTLAAVSMEPSKLILFTLPKSKK
jgi:hypothetical protein